MKNKTYITFETKKSGTIEMSKDTFARWLCLAEAFYVIDKKAEDLNLDLNKQDWVKPLAFEKYIDQRMEGMLLDLDHDEKNNLIGKTSIHHSFEPEFKEDSIVSTVY
jgi:hypothetical protein